MTDVRCPSFLAKRKNNLNYFTLTFPGILFCYCQIYPFHQIELFPTADFVTLVEFFSQYISVYFYLTLLEEVLEHFKLNVIANTRLKG